MSELLNEMQQISNAMNLRLRVQYADCASVCSSIIQTTLLAASLLLCAVGQAQTGTTVTWAGGNSSLGWADPANWNPQFSPLNNSEKSFTVIVPDYTSLTYDIGASGLIDALSFGTGSYLLITNGQYD